MIGYIFIIHKTRFKIYLDFMHEFWTNSTTNMMYTRSQNYTSMVVGQHGIQTFEVVVVALLLSLLSFDVFVPQGHIPYYF